MSRRTFVHIFVVSVLFCLTTQRGHAQTTVFTYQGSLQDSGMPANGAFQMQFKLFDSLGAAGQIGSTIADIPVTVAQGIFSVNLDFGATPFSGANRWLEIAVRRNSGESYTTLTPREQIASAPYSIRTLSAATADNALSLGGVAASQYLQTNGNGSGLSNLNAGSITTGTLSNARLGQIPTANIADSAVTAPKIASGQVVKSVNTLKDDVTLAAGSNVSITPSGNTLTIAATGGSNAILNQATLQSPANFNISGNGFIGGNVGIGTVTPNTGLTLNSGTPWTANAWTAAMNLQNTAAFGWEANGSGQRLESANRPADCISFARTARSAMADSRQSMTSHSQIRATGVSGRLFQ